MDFVRVNKLQRKLKELRPLNDAEVKRLRQEFLIDNTYNTNAIEGNTLSLRETALIIQEGITVAGKHIKEHLEVIGHKEAFEYIIDLAQKGAPLTERVIKDIHSLVLMNDRQNSGVYRSVPVMIMGATNKPPQPYLVQEQVEELINDYPHIKAEKHIIQAVAEFHLRFEGIHPFIDGNGRTGRLILNLELIKAGFLPVNIKFSDRQKYYDCFDDYFKNRQNTQMLTNLILNYEIDELSKYINIIEGKA